MTIYIKNINMFQLFFSPVILNFDNQTQSNNHKYRHTKASCTIVFVAALLLGKDWKQSVWLILREQLNYDRAILPKLVQL